MDRQHRREWERNYRRLNREKEVKRHRESYLKNREAILIRAKERYYLNREKKLITNAAWRKQNPDKMRRYTEAWSKKNRTRRLESARVQSHKRRTLRRRGECDIQSINILVQLIRAAEKMKCAICDHNMPVGDRSIDHVIPLSRGGSGDIGNLQVVHRKCNLQKYAKMPHELDGQMQIHLVGRVA